MPAKKANKHFEEVTAQTVVTLRELRDELRKRLDECDVKSKALEVEVDEQRGEKDQAQEALMREYHYHMLRAEELKAFLRGCGYSFGDD